MLSYFVQVNMPTTSGRKKSKNFYPGLNLSNTLIYNQYMMEYKQVVNNVGEQTEILEHIFEFIEEDTVLKLKKGSLWSEVLENDMLTFFEKWDSELVFHKDTLVADDVSDIENFIPISNLDSCSVLQILEYITKVSSLNENVSKFFINNGDIFTKGCNTWSSKISDMFQSIVYNLSFSFSGIEKMINAGQEKLLLKNFQDRNFALVSNTKKLSQSVGLPPFALPIIKKLRIESSIDYLSDIASMVDGNSLKILLEFVDNYSSFITIKEIGTSKERDLKLSEFFKNLAEIIRRGYKMQDTLNYVLRQRMYWNRDGLFGFPFEDTSTFLDYLNLNQGASLKCEKYPQNLRRMHDVLVQNLKDFDESKNDDFKAAVAKYAKYENEFKKDGYCFIVPRDIRALIQEGNDLHHCIGSYIDKIISGESKIFFMRKSSERNTSFVTIEIDDSCDITEIKGMFNTDPEPEIIAIANKWAGTCKRLK